MCSKLILLPSLAICVAAFCVKNVFSAATEEQMNAAGAMMRDVCFPKFPTVTKEIADGVKIGQIPDDKDVKCYINCVMEMMQSIKKGKFLLESSLKQVDILMPDHYKAEYRTGLNACKNAATGIKNNCEAAHTLLLCLRKEIKNFVFP